MLTLTGKFSIIITALCLYLLASVSCTQMGFVANQNAVFNIADFGAAGDGMADDSDSFRQVLDEIGDYGATIIIPRGEFQIDDVIFPDNVTLVFRSGGKILVPEGGNVVIKGMIEAGIDQIFSGRGSITGGLDNLHVYPQWFGARGDGVHNDAPALQQAADLAAESMGNTLFIPAGEYLFLNDIEIRSNVECRGLLVKELEIDEDRTQFSYVIYVPTHYPKNNPHVIFSPDNEELELDMDYFYGIEEGELEVPAYRDIPLAEDSGNTDLAEGGTLRFYSSDFFSSRNNQKGDQFYDKRDIAQIVSGRGDLFPEFAFSYQRPPASAVWSRNAVYEKGDYVRYGGEIFKATWSSGEGSSYEHPFQGIVNIGSVQPNPESETTRYEFSYNDGSEDTINIWRRVETRVWYRSKDRPLTVNGLRMEVRLKGHEGETKRISAGAMSVNRSNMTFNNLEITVRDREATLSSLLSSNNAVNLEFNNGYFSGATSHGLGYNIRNNYVANVRYNHCISTNSRKGMDGHLSKNVTVNGGFYNVIDDHYGRNFIIRDVVMSGQSTNIPGYVTPDADLQAWHFRTIRPFGFTGGNLYIENVTVNEASGGILSVRGDIGDLYGTIVLRDITIRRNKEDVHLFNHSINPDFDFASEVRTPDRMIIEDIGLENPGRLTLNVGSGFDSSTYGPVDVRNSGPFGDVQSSSTSLTFSGCQIKDAQFRTEPGALIHFRNCTFLGEIYGLDETNIGTAFGNVKTGEGGVSYPVNLLHEELIE